MIIPLPLVVSLLLAISYATELDYKFELDWTRCSQDTACYVRQSCLVGKENDAASKAILVHFKEKNDDGSDNMKLPDSNCDLVIQIKAVTDDKYLIWMEVGGPELKIEEGMKIVHGDKEISCTESNTVKGNEKVNADFTVEARTMTSPKFDAEKMTCSFLLKSTDSRIPIKNSFVDSAPSLVYHVNSEIKVTFNKGGKAFWELPTLAPLKCKGEKIVFNFDDESKIYELTEVDNSKMIIKCENSSILVKYNGKAEKVQQITCAVEKWSWTGESAIIVPAEDPFSAACIKQKYCMSCTTLPAEVAETECPKDECKKPTVEEVDGCKVLKCTDNSYTIDGKNNQKMAKPVSCEQKGEEKIATWFIHDTNTPKEVPTVSCRTIKSCVASEVSKACPDGVTPCNDNIIVGKHNVTCAPADGILHDKDGPSQEGARCDTETGKWSPENPGPFYCAEEVKVEPKKEEPATGGSGAIIGAVFGIFVAIGIVGAVCYYFLVYKKKQNNTKQAGSSNKGKSGKDRQSKEAKSKSGDSNKKKDSASDNNKDSEKPKDGAAAAGDPKKPESTPATPSAAPTATPPPDAAKPAAAAPPKSDPAAAADGTTAI